MIIIPLYVNTYEDTDEFIIYVKTKQNHPLTQVNDEEYV